MSCQKSLVQHRALVFRLRQLRHYVSPAARRVSWRHRRLDSTSEQVTQLRSDHSDVRVSVFVRHSSSPLLPPPPRTLAHWLSLPHNCYPGLMRQKYWCCGSGWSNDSPFLSSKRAPCLFWLPLLMLREDNCSLRFTNDSDKMKLVWFPKVFWVQILDQWIICGYSYFVVIVVVLWFVTVIWRQYYHHVWK